MPSGSAFLFKPTEVAARRSQGGVVFRGATAFLHPALNDRARGIRGPTNEPDNRLIVLVVVST